MVFGLKKRTLYQLIMILFVGIWLFTTACSGTKYYNRYPKDKECKVKDKGKKGWKK